MCDPDVCPSSPEWKDVKKLHIWWKNSPTRRRVVLNSATPDCLTERSKVTVLRVRAG